MSVLPQVAGDRLVRALQKRGWTIVHQKGSHVVLRHPTDSTRRTVIPVNKGHALHKGLLHAILKEADVSPEQLRTLL